MTMSSLLQVHVDAGPLVFYPGSNKASLWDFDALGDEFTNAIGGKRQFVQDDYSVYERMLQPRLERDGFKPAYAVVKRGEVFLWQASLCHGGANVRNKTKSRLSQVTHYFFEGGSSFWQPRVSSSYADIMDKKPGAILTSKPTKACPMSNWAQPQGASPSREPSCAKKLRNTFGH